MVSRYTGASTSEIESDEAITAAMLLELEESGYALGSLLVPDKEIA